MGATSNLLAQGQTALNRATTPTPARTRDPAQARDTAVEFEAVFLSQMIEHMFAGIKTDGLFGGGNGENMYRSFMFQEFGKVLAKAGGIGIADAVQREILKTQEVE